MTFHSKDESGHNLLAEFDFMIAPSEDPEDLNTWEEINGAVGQAATGLVEDEIMEICDSMDAGVEIAASVFALLGHPANDIDQW